jgi:transposase
MRKFAANVKSAFSNKANGNIARFGMRFKSKKGNPLTMFSVDARGAQIIDAEGGKPLLSIPGLRDILIRYDGDTVITSEVQIIIDGGCWYAVIPSFVEPPDPNLQGGCIALDPGIRTFLTGVDLSGNVVEIGGNSVDRATNEIRPVRAHLERYKTRANQAQHDLAVLPKVSSRRSARQWKAYARAKHAFSCTNAKTKN